MDGSTLADMQAHIHAIADPFRALASHVRLEVKILRQEAPEPRSVLPPEGKRRVSFAEPEDGACGKKPRSEQPEEEEKEVQPMERDTPEEGDRFVSRLSTPITQQDDLHGAPRVLRNRAAAVSNLSPAADPTALSHASKEGR